VYEKKAVVSADGVWSPVVKLVKGIGKRQLYTKGETINKTTLKHRTHKIENTYKKKHTNSIELHCE
jgi:hypothetical protein